MDWTATIALAAVALVVGLFSAWRGSRPARPFARPRMAPWKFLMAASVAVLVFAVVHMLNLAGVTTGGRLR